MIHTGFSLLDHAHVPGARTSPQVYGQLEVDGVSYSELVKAAPNEVLGIEADLGSTELETHEATVAAI